MISIRNLLNPKAVKLVTLTLTRDMLIDGVPRFAGDVLELSARTAEKVVGSGGAIDQAGRDEAIEKQAKLDEMLPPPQIPEDMPLNWKSLPPSFEKWHSLNQAGTVLLRRANLIEEKLMELAGRYTIKSDLSSVSRMPNSAQKSKLIAGIVSALHIGELPKEHIESLRHLTDSFQRATTAFSEWQQAYGEKLLVHKIECSDHVFTIHGELSRTCRSLSECGFEIFKTRIAALGLSEHKAKELYSGSADSMKYSAPAVAPDLQDIRLLWHLDSGKDQKFILEKPVTSLARMLEDFSIRNGELLALLKMAKQELAKAQKVSQAA